MSRDASQRVIDAEMAALESLRFMSDRIARAADAILRSQRRVIVSGMGKAGHVGRKIAATFQSTGQPAAFLHPGEAMHGDLGMVEMGDTMLLLSNSGQTDEVLHIAHYAKGLQCPLVVVTGNHASPLAALADFPLVYANNPEGCPIGRAPMASAIVMMAIGDCVAAELMVRRGFTEQQFLLYHHGGYLGRTIAREE